MTDIPQNIRSHLAAMPHFAMLPAEDLNYLAEITTYERFLKGRELAIQSKTQLSYIYLIRRGQVSIYEEKDGQRLHGGYIKAGEVFGGISLLMNAGVSLRTVIVDEETEAYLIPKEFFLDLCTRYKNFFGYFIENFSKHIADPALEIIISSGQARHFLGSIAPFFLSDEIMEMILSAISLVYHYRGSVLFIQGRSRVGYLYILYKGAAERYYEQNGQKTIQEIIGEGDLYGGISMLPFRMS